MRAIYERLRKAILHKQNFKVYVVIPIHAAGDPSDNTTRYIMKYTYESISRGPGSIMGKLLREFRGLNVYSYIGFYSLRNYGFLNGTAVTEQIYIHAKLLIVDDKTVIIGSANINDRSMVRNSTCTIILSKQQLGDRDSEICAKVEHQDFISATFGGRRVRVSKFAHDLRKRLWRDYLGLDAKDESVADPGEINLELSKLTSFL